MTSVSLCSLHTHSTLYPNHRAHGAKNRNVAYSGSKGPCVPPITNNVHKSLFARRSRGLGGSRKTSQTKTGLPKHAPLKVRPKNRGLGEVKERDTFVQLFKSGFCWYARACRTVKRRM